MTLRDLIIDDVQDVFGNTDDFAEELTLRRRGNPDDAETILCIVSADDEQGTGSKAHMTNSEMHGRRANADIYVEILTPDITINIGTEMDTLVLSDGRIANAVMAVGRDAGCTAWLFRAPLGINTKSSRPKI